MHKYIRISGVSRGLQQEAFDPPVRLWIGLASKAFSECPHSPWRRFL